MKTFPTTKRIAKMIFVVLVTVTMLTATIANAEGNNAFLRSAKRCHDYIAENDFDYSQGVTLPLDREGNHRVDCSSYVSWSIYDYTNGAFKTSQTSHWFNSVAKDLLAGRTPELPEITSSWEAFDDPADFEPGDIMCYSGHVHIYAGRGTNGEYLAYNAGSDTSIDEHITVISERYFKKALYAIRVW